MTRSSRYGSLLVLAALARAVTGCAGTADGEIPCVEDVTCPDQFPVCGSAGKCIAGSSSEKATVAIVGPEGYMPAEFVAGTVRSEEHTSELQSQSNLVCRLLLEKK